MTTAVTFASCLLILSPLASATGPLEKFREACGDDAARLCSGVAPGGGRILRCLAAKEDQVSDPCREALKGPSSAADAKDEEHFLEHGGLKRRYLVHVPKGYDGNKPLPVVISLHGGFGKPEGQRRQSGLNRVADSQGFMVVYPEGLYRSWNAGHCCGRAMRDNLDDVGFIRAMISELAQNGRIDPKRVYATGMSNGAMMAYRLACELSDRVAAIAPVAGVLDVDGPIPGRPVPVLHFHGKKDPNCAYAGGVGEKSFTRIAHRSVPETIAWWVKANHCRPDPVETKTGDDYVMERYEPASGEKGAPIVLYTFPEGGHTWPGGIDVTKGWGTGKLIQDVDASRLMWEFFSRYSLP